MRGFRVLQDWFWSSESAKPQVAFCRAGSENEAAGSHSRKSRFSVHDKQFLGKKGLAKGPVWGFREAGKPA